MENVADADAAWIDARIRAAWDALVFSFDRPDNPEPERHETVEIVVARDDARVTFRGHTFFYPLNASYARVYGRMDRSMFFVHARECIARLARFVARECEVHVADDEATLVVTPTYASTGALAHWLPRETIRNPADEERMARALADAV